MHVAGRWVPLSWPGGALVEGCRLLRHGQESFVHFPVAGVDHLRAVDPIPPKLPPPGHEGFEGLVVAGGVRRFLLGLQCEQADEVSLGFTDRGEVEATFAFPEVHRRSLPELLR